MATSSISANFEITKKSTARRFMKALKMSGQRNGVSGPQEKAVLLSKEEALGILKKKSK